MKLLLKEHVDKLGRRGDVVEVAGGFGRNYLIPRGLAVPATGANARQLEFEQKKFEAAETVKKEQLSGVARTIAETSWAIEAKANEEGHLFGSVTYRDIRGLLAAQGVEVDERALVLSEPEKYPIKERGIYPFKVHLHADIVAEAKLWVVEEAEKKSPDARKEAEVGER